MTEPCRHERCIHYNKQKKCPKCGRAYHNKYSISELVKLKFTLPYTDMFITKKDLSESRRVLIGNSIILGIVITVGTLFILIFAGFFR